MIELNCMSGMKRKVVRMTIVTEVDLLVGGEDDSDRIDSVVEMFDDHYDEVVNNSFFRAGVSSMELTKVEVID